MYVININRLLRELQLHYQQLQKQDSPDTSEDSDQPSIYDSLKLYNHILSCLYDWGADAVLEDLLVKRLGLSLPSPERCFASMSDKGQALFVLFPTQSRGLTRWEVDPLFSACQALSLSSISMSLLSSGDPGKQVYFSQIVAHYNVQLPHHLPTYMEPDIAALACFSLNVNEEIHRVARLLLQGVIERTSTESRAKLIRIWSAYYKLHPTAPALPPHETSLSTVSPVSSSSPAKDKDDPKTSSGSAPAVSQPPTDPFADAKNETISDEELMTALVLCLIGVYDSSTKEQRIKQQTHGNYDVGPSYNRQLIF